MAKSAKPAQISIWPHRRRSRFLDGILGWILSGLRREAPPREPVVSKRIVARAPNAWNDLPHGWSLSNAHRHERPS
ncbi:hypothetical protein BWP39_09485 [Paraburkholderia acidicola]|uniref:Uncharacterized protein n=1 Tax=Paraburkholderia acidicola TaxID=1912599 RepID=A0A2A4F0V3_9BURK|nr:hypothetical protein BWP39_09485 [Paraburkholderia acidicola]